MQRDRASRFTDSPGVAFAESLKAREGFARRFTPFIELSPTFGGVGTPARLADHPGSLLGPP